MKKWVVYTLLFTGLCFCGNSNTKTDQQESNTENISIQTVSDKFTICSFNIQFLGNFKSRKDTVLAELVKDYDIVVVQELVAPPIDGVYPDGKAFTKDKESIEFFDAMKSFGFVYSLSEEDTGPRDNFHSKGSATEWFVAFYKSDKFKIADDIPSGFLADDRSKHPVYRRVPYAFAFETLDAKMDFVLISVHLEPEDKVVRKNEINEIAKWIDANDQFEKDFIVLGDMNIQSKVELEDVMPAGFISLNDECRTTNTNLNGPKPYDHVFYNPSFTANEIDEDFDMKVINLIEELKDSWASDEPYPGDPYNHNKFRQAFSDHHPIIFIMQLTVSDDDNSN
jgi:endonuclease/exonuclease/phosphatase family metal-dependent hydrolase